ncbi:MAG: SAM-dependent chlorinase/fluorinase [Acidobacteria bacterium]|nr:SAM-dependent chlorinase/fluorinase [Acidobacteriota bacterium]
MRPLITLITDFGLREYFVGAMKGAILSVNPDTDIVDVTHDVRSHDIPEAAFTLRCAYSFFPPRTIHVVVVDPGVGSARRALIVSAAGHYFVGPDNGVFSLIYQSETVERVISITAEHYFRRPVSDTFHGRDIFGPVAAWIGSGIEIGKFGEAISDYVKLTIPKLVRDAAGVVRGVVLHIDRFGNLITSISAAELAGIGKARKFSVAGKEIHRIVRSYSDGLPAEPFALVGSAGFFEIAAQQSSAATLLQAQQGNEVLVYLE